MSCLAHGIEKGLSSYAWVAKARARHKKRKWRATNARSPRSSARSSTRSTRAIRSTGAARRKRRSAAPIATSVAAVQAQCYGDVRSICRSSRADDVNKIVKDVKIYSSRLSVMKK